MTLRWLRWWLRTRWLGGLNPFWSEVLAWSAEPFKLTVRIGRWHILTPPGVTTVDVEVVDERPSGRVRLCAGWLPVTPWLDGTRVTLS